MLIKVLRSGCGVLGDSHCGEGIGREASEADYSADIHHEGIK